MRSLGGMWKMLERVQVVVACLSNGDTRHSAGGGAKCRGREREGLANIILVIGMPGQCTSACQKYSNNIEIKSVDSIVD